MSAIPRESPAAGVAPLGKPPPKLLAIDVCKSFQTKDGATVVAVDRVGFEVENGRFVCLLGPSGCGKSTFLNMAAGLDRPTSGRIYMDHDEITGPGAERGMVFQTYTLFPWLSVRRNVEFGPMLRGVPRAERREIARHYLDLVGLADFSEAHPTQLSGGMRQRVALARVLANKPELLLMDEPFGALDAQTRETIQDLFLRIWGEEKVTVLFVTHDVEEAIYLSDRVILFTARPGRIKADVASPFPRPRDRGLKLSREFVDLKREMIALLRPEDKGAAEEQARHA